MLHYRKMEYDEAEQVVEIDATNFIRNVWRKDSSGEYRLMEINWTDVELPNGFDWHLRRFRETIEKGGTAFGCLDGDTLVGYATLNATVFGKQGYVFLDQLFISKGYRGKSIGKELFRMCAVQASQIGAKKIYLCAGSSENTIAFYRKLGCVSAAEPNQKLLEEDPRDIQLEYLLRGLGNEIGNGKTDLA